MRISMKNDLDLIRAILEEVESWEYANPNVVEVAGWPEHVVARHVERLGKDGLLENSGQFIAGDFSDPAHLIVRDLTSRGHEFLGAIRSGDVLERLKSALKPSELAALSMGKLANLAGELAEQAIRKKLGL